MSQEHNQQPKKIRQRKCGIENDTRQFRCPCGKGYLSYPALYTHIKTKHEGQAPGDITKPKTQKTRGRPRNIIVDTPIDDTQADLHLKEEVEKVLQNVSINYHEQFMASNGKKTCQDMATIFLQQLWSLDIDKMKVLKCFLNQLKLAVANKYGQNYWSEDGPAEIIYVANQFQHNHQQYKDKYPISNSTLIQLTYIFFKWMYRNNWTQHKLTKRNTQVPSQIN